MTRAAYIHGTDGAEQERLALLNRLTNEAFVRFLDVKESEAVLEVGSGLGILAGEVAARASEGEVWGVEFSAAQLSKAGSDAPNLRFVRADAHALPFADESFDLTYCRYVLEHVADPARVLEEMRRVLKPGGRACAQENNILVNVLDPPCPRFEKVWRAFAELQRRLGGDALIGGRLFSLFKRAGFDRVELSIQPEIHYAGEPTFRPWMENVAGNVRGGARGLITEGLASATEVEGALAELSDFAGREDASMTFYWNRAAGLKS
ncbi:MAG TPA: methyltransferase domain-containing protein [Pyrinomonadaceae bacterium]|nr:methyltransferase domain-containing protein [Pyrinomonadaceae bacterium]